MEAEKYMKQVNILRRKIQTKKERLEELENMAFLPLAIHDNTKVQTSRTPDSMERFILSGIKEKEELQGEIMDCYKEIKQINRTIEELKLNEFLVLYGLYIKNLTRWELADQEEKSVSWVDQNRKKALQNLQAILDKE